MITIQRERKESICADCGQNVSAIAGHPNNWPRVIARSTASLKEALSALMLQVDEHNRDFAVMEFADEWDRQPRKATN